MEQLTVKYEEKMIRAGLCERGSPLFGLRNGGITWNRPDRRGDLLHGALADIDRNVFLFAEPAEPYRTIIDFLADEAGSTIYPRDFETGILLTDLPVVTGFDAGKLNEALKKRRGVIIAGHGILTAAKESPERAFVIFSSICIACFIKFFVDYLHHTRLGKTDVKRKEAFMAAVDRLDPMPPLPGDFTKGPFDSEEAVLTAIDEAGKRTVASRLVDSNFGNISYRMGDILYISRTGSALDELPGRIDAVSLRETADIPSTVSTEYPAHRQIVTTTNHRAVLHGHPKFPVILSMDCDRPHCECRNACQIKCPYPRAVGNVPIVPGEAGAGPHGLSHTVPPALKTADSVIVYGHGLFAAGPLDFNEAFRSLWNAEDFCRREYFNRL